MKYPVWRPLYLLLKSLGRPVAWEVSAGAVIFRETPGGREYLLLRYPSGHYDFARGHQEGDETERETALREVEEETGLSHLELFPKRISFRFYYEAQGEERRKRVRSGRGLMIFKEVILFPARVGESTIAISHEHSEYLWLSYQDAVRRATYPNAKKALTITEEFLRSHA